MNVFRIVGLIFFCAVCLHAEDFSLDYNGTRPIALHTVLTYEGKGERLVATARNESGADVMLLRICILSSSVKTGCLFEVWNTEVLARGGELRWNVTTGKKVSNLSHDATLEEFDNGNTAAPSAQPAISVPPQSAIQTRAPGQPASETLTNETIIKLAKAGLGDDVIIGMIGRQPGSYSHGSADIIRMKEAGVSDKVIGAVLDSKPVSSDAATSRQRVEANSRFYVGSMEANLDNFITAEIIKQKGSSEKSVGKCWFGQLAK